MIEATEADWKLLTDLLVERFALQPLTLPHGKVRVLNRQLRQGRVLPIFVGFI